MTNSKLKKYGGIVLVLIMVLSGFGVFLGSGDDGSTRYNDFKFIPAGNQYSTEIDKIKTFFNYLPEQLENMNVSTAAIEQLKTTQQVYVTYNPASNFTSDIAEMEFFITEELEKRFQKYVIHGLTDSTGTLLPEISCQNATESIPAIYFTESDNDKIEWKDNCLIIESTHSNTVRAQSDRIRYSLYGVMK